MRWLLSLVVTPLIAQGVHAAGFDPDTGTVSVGDAAGSVTFDDVASLQSAGVQGYGFPNFDPVDITLVAEGLDDNGIEGSGALKVGGDVVYMSVDLGSVADLAGKRSEMVVWQQPHGTRVLPYVEWYGNLVAGDNAPFLGRVTFMPTGIVTSDGWEEWSSGPVDWQWGGAFGPTVMNFLDAQLTPAYGGATWDTRAFTLLDGLYVKDLGDAAVPASACTLLDEATTCGDDGLCQMGRCVDGAQRMGANAPFTKDAREDYLNRRIFELDHFEGGRVPQTKVVDVQAALEGVELQDHARAYWGTLNAVYGLMQDGHASAPTMAYPPYSNANVCIHEGDADLLPVDAVAPIVFRSGGDNVVSAQLEAGDALVAVDGVDPTTWMAAAQRLIVHHGDPAAASVVLAPSIISAALDTGAVLTFARCAGPAACDANALETFDVDLTALVGDPIANGEQLDFFYDFAPCDNRFLRPVAGNIQNVTAYQFAGFADDNGVRSLLINGVPAGGTEGADDWFSTVQNALNDNSDKILLDERTGDGGGVDAVDWIAGFLLEDTAVYGMDFLPSFEEGDDAETRATLLTCMTGQTDDYACGNAFRWVLGDIAGGARGTAATAKLAVLTTLDVSGNDYLTRLVKERETGETRIFGPSPTFGAFGVIWGAAPHLAELSGGSFQVHDTLFLQSDTDTNTDFATSTGVPPDEIVRQKQSDARLGVDTLLARANAWLHE